MSKADPVLFGIVVMLYDGKGIGPMSTTRSELTSKRVGLMKHALPEFSLLPTIV